MTVSKLMGVQNRWVMMVLMMVGHTEAADIQLGWDPPPAQVTGYKLYYGTSSGDYSGVVDVGSQTSYNLSGLEGDQGYYFTVTAYDDVGNESPFADEVSATLTASYSDPPNPLGADAFDEAGDSEVSDASGAGNHVTTTGATWTSQRGHAFATSPKVPVNNGLERVLQQPIAANLPNTQSFVSSAVPHLASEHIESGEVDVDRQWTRVGFRKAFVDPIVVAKARGDRQAHPAVVGIRGVDAQGFEVQLRSSGDGETPHPAETIGYLVIERGEYVLPNGIQLEVGSVELEGANAASAVIFSQRFSATPVVMTSISGTPESEVVNGRPMMIGKHGFQLLIQTASQDQRTAPPLSIDYIAWEPSEGAIDGLTFEINRSGPLREEALQTILFQQAFEEAPVFLAEVQEFGTGDALGVCWDYKSAESVEVTVTSNGAATTETARRDLVMGYIAVRETVLD